MGLVEAKVRAVFLVGISSSNRSAGKTNPTISSGTDAIHTMETTHFGVPRAAAKQMTTITIGADKNNKPN